MDVDLETDSPSAHRFQRAGPGGRKTPTQVNSCKKLGKKMGFISIEIYISYGINNDIILTKYIVTFDVKKGEEPFWSKDENYKFCLQILDWKKNSNKLGWQEDTYQFGWKENTNR